MAEPMADVFHQLADALSEPAGDWRGAVDDVLSRSGVRDATVEGSGQWVLVSWRDPQGLDFCLRVLRSVERLGGEYARPGDVGELTTDDIAGAVNGGVLTDELNDAVGWDADLVV